MKLTSLLIVAALAGGSVLYADIVAGNANIGSAIVKQFGEAQLKNVMLVTAAATDDDPTVWTAYAMDPYRPGEQVRTRVTKQDGRWWASPDGAGQLLPKLPKLPVDFKRLTVDAKSARRLIDREADIMNVDYDTMSYQLATNETTLSPEWGIALQDDNGIEVGFCVVSGETGRIISEDWTPKAGSSVAVAPGGATQEGAAAAKEVKKSVRKAWNWTENAGKKTGGFFKELFK
jgi:hypothetical protein